MPRPVAFAYEHVYPESVGGAQRYYWALTRELAKTRPVTYITANMWEGEPVVHRDGVEVVGICAKDGNYRLALARHLARHAGRYAVVHAGCFPSGAPLAARVAMGLHRRRRELVVDWHEVLPHERWIHLFGHRGYAGSLFQKLAINAGDVAITFSRMHEERLRQEGRRREILRLPEFLPEGDPGAGDLDRPREKLVISLARLEQEKRVELLPPVVAALRRRDPEWRGVVFGDGPQRATVEQAIADAGAGDAVRMAGFAPWAEVEDHLARASVLLFPTEREGFGLVVLEAAAQGLPTVLVRGPYNAATELIEQGRNGMVCDSHDPEELASAVLAISGDGAARRTRGWFEEAEQRLSLAAAAAAHEELYARLGVS